MLSRCLLHTSSIWSRARALPVARRIVCWFYFWLNKYDESGRSTWNRLQSRFFDISKKTREPQKEENRWKPFSGKHINAGALRLPVDISAIHSSQSHTRQQFNDHAIAGEFFMFWWRIVCFEQSECFDRPIIWYPVLMYRWYCYCRASSPLVLLHHGKMNVCHDSTIAQRK